MEFYCLGSGSNGNAYIFKCGNECILVECGFEYKKLCSKILNAGISVSDIKAVVCTHRHKDHTESLSNWVNSGFKVVAPENCFTNEELVAQNVCCAKNGRKIDLTENIKILAFDVNHDCDALGYIFHFKQSKERLLFINDTNYFDFPYRKQCFDYIFVECNHIRTMLNDIKIKNEHLVAKYERQANYHLSLAALKKFLRELNLSKTKQIYLMHGSRECCDKDLCRKVIALNFDVETYFCEEHGGFSRNEEL